MTRLDHRPWLLLGLAACGSVVVPAERFYRLAVPAPETAPLQEPQVLRVQSVRLAAALASDRILVSDGGVRVHPYELDRWIGPLDGLVQDALVQGLTRTRAFAQVKGPGDGGRDDVQLAARVLDFCRHEADGKPFGRAEVEIRLLRSTDGRVLWQRELVACVASAGDGPAAAVQALSVAMAQVVQGIVQGCRESGVLAGPAR